MQKIKSIALILGVLAMSILVGYFVLAAWTDAPGAPPTCPTGYPGCDAPINVGSVDQIKSGGLSVGAFVSRFGTILARDSGNVGIGTASPGAKLDIQVSVGSDAVKINTFKIRPISNTELGIYDSGGNLILILD